MLKYFVYLSNILFQIPTCENILKVGTHYNIIAFKKKIIL